MRQCVGRRRQRHRNAPPRIAIDSRGAYVQRSLLHGIQDLCIGVVRPDGLNQSRYRSRVWRRRGPSELKVSVGFAAPPTKAFTPVLALFQ